MAEIKEFIPSTPPFPEKAGQAKERPKPEKPVDVVDIEEARKKIAKRDGHKDTVFVFPDTESQELMETVSGLVKKLFEDSRDKKTVVEHLRKLADQLEQSLKK